MRFLITHLPDVVATLLGMAGLWYVVRRWISRPGWRIALMLAGWGLLGAGLLLRAARVSAMVPLPVSDNVRLGSFMLLLFVAAASLTTLVFSLLPEAKPHHSPERRRFLGAVRAAVLASPVVATGYGVFIQRDDFRVREVSIRVPGLDRALDELRIVQISDIHLSPFLSEEELARAIDMANETRAHLAVVTGDLITGYRDPLDACIRQIGRLRTEAGTLGCLGNHERYAQVEKIATKNAARLGIKFLRDESQVLTFRGQPLNFAGVDYQSMHSEYLVGTGRHVRQGMPNILLSHNPDVFPVAAKQGFGLTLAGHTHGGQITVEILHQNLSIARFYTPYVYGLYEENGAAVYVTRGIGTVGLPARIGAPPEISLIRLCAI